MDQNDEKEWTDEEEEEDDDSDDEEDDEDDEDEDGDDVKRSNNDGWSEMKQHGVALLIGIIAACIAYFNHSETATPGQLWLELRALMFTSPQQQQLGGGHNHVQNYTRTCNISICAPLSLEENKPKQYNNRHLHAMETKLLTRELRMALEYHYRADVFQDNDYTQLIQSMTQNSFDVDSYALNSCDVGDNDATTTTTTWTLHSLVYKTPPLTEMENVVVSSDEQKKIQPAYLTFSGFSAKFVNLSPKPILLHWDGPRGQTKLIAEIPPMDSVGTATLPGQGFFVSPTYDSTHALQRWTLTADTAIAEYHPEYSISDLSPDLQIKYRMQQLNSLYARDYLASTGRHWLANFPRPMPVHPMWPTKYIGQVFKVVSKHGYYQQQPTTERPRAIQLKFSVLSVAPRVLEIQNFLSDFECQYIIQKAHQRGFHDSQVVGKGGKKQSLNGRVIDRSIRSSYTSWLERNTEDVIMEQIYQRAANVLQLKQDLLQHQQAPGSASDYHYSHATHHSVAESMQIVHYNKSNAEYTPHHDFVHPPMMHRHQPTRFCTLLIYLNTIASNDKGSDTGGETTFPRAIQSTRHDGLTVTPLRGKAILFYNMLPDGNVDDLSQHGSQALQTDDGEEVVEKYVANLWIWDPVIN